jgi:hypothetical protein
VSGFGHCITTKPAPASLSGRSAARPFDLIALQDQEHPADREHRAASPRNLASVATLAAGIAGVSP